MRVVRAEQALSYLPLYGEVWYQAANWQAEIGDVQGEAGARAWARGS